MAQIRLPSGEVRCVRENCKATIGQVGNTDWATSRSVRPAGSATWVGGPLSAALL